MKSIPVWALSLALVLAAAGGTRAEGTLEKVKSKGVLVAGVKNDSPPFGFVDRISGEIVGFDPDYVSALALKLGVRAQLRPVDPGTATAELISGDVDVIAANLTRSPARDRIMDFSKTYLVTGQGFLAKKGMIRGMRDLWGKKIGAVIGSPSETCARNYCPGGTIVPFDDYDQAIEALMKGKVDAFTTDQAILLDILSTLPGGDYEIADFLISEEQYVLGVRQGDTAFVEFLDKSIEEMERSGQAAAIKAKWFAPPEDRPPAGYGAIVRKAAAPPRFLAVALNGLFYPRAEVAVFSPDGNYIGEGVVASAAGDEFYLDVDPAVYDLVGAGYLVTLNVSHEMARELASRQQSLLGSVRRDAEEEAAKIDAESEREAIEAQRRAEQVDLMREQNRQLIQRERQYYYNFRRFRR